MIISARMVFLQIWGVARIVFGSEPKQSRNRAKRSRNGPETEPKRSRNGAKWSQTEPKRTQTEPKWTEIKLSGMGRPGGFIGVGGGGVGVVREKKITTPAARGTRNPGQSAHASSTQAVCSLKGQGALVRSHLSGPALRDTARLSQ